MADLTLYLASEGAAPHDCAYSASWEGTAGAAHLPATTTLGSIAIAWRNCTRNSGGYDGCGGQWVSPAQSARSWTTADTFDIAIHTYDDNGSGGTTLYLVVRIFNAAGDTVVGTLYDGVINAVNWVGALTSRHADGVAVQNNVDMPENGHIVVEIGMHDTYAATFGNKIYCGETGVNGPIPLSDADTDSAKYPWIAFTYGAASATNVVLNII